MAKGAKKANGTRKPRGVKVTGKGGNGRPLAKSDNESSEAIAAGFHSLRGKWSEIQNRLALAKKQLSEFVADAKASGYQKQHFIIADQLQKSPKSEAKVIATVETRITVARWMGHGLGNQYDLFANAPKQDPEEAAYADGKRVAMEGGNAVPPTKYANDTLEQQWLSGYHETQSKMVKEGIKPLEATPAGWGQ